LHATFGMFKHRQPFDGSKIFALTATEIATPEVAA
jgi:hypothetical protein